MKQFEIEKVISNIRNVDSIYDEINQLFEKKNSLVKKLKYHEKKIDELEIKRMPENEFDKTNKLNIKRTFNQILDEIARQNNIPRENIFIRFKEIYLSFGHDVSEPKEKIIKKEINYRGNFIINFSIASDMDCLEEDSFFVTEEENDKREKRKIQRKKDPIYGNYHFNARPFEVQKNGKRLCDLLLLKKLFYGTVFDIYTGYEGIYYYISPNHINLDYDDVFAKALKSLLTREELDEYYDSKKIYNDLVQERKAQIEYHNKHIALLKESLGELNKEIYALREKVDSLKWPKIEIRLGDFIDEIYSSNDTIINNENSKLRVWCSKFEDDITEKTKTNLTFRIRASERVRKLHFIEDFSWTMSYSKKMYDKKTLYKHFKDNRGRGQWFFKNKWIGYKKIKDFVFCFDPIYFFNCTYKVFDKDDYLKEEVVRKCIVKCMILELLRENGLPLTNDVIDYYFKSLYMDFLEIPELLELSEESDLIIEEIKEKTNKVVENLRELRKDYKELCKKIK